MKYRFNTGDGKMKKKFYTAPDGTIYPLTEAQYDMAFKVYKSDRPKAEIGNPYQCFIALGVRRHPDVLDAYIGSGKDGYVVFKGVNGQPDHAVHFTIPAAAGKVRDSFETKGAPATQLIVLRAPTKARTHAARAVSEKTRRAAVKAGTAAPVKPRGPQKAPRIIRLGVKHRPRPILNKDGGVDTSPIAA